MIRLLSLSTTGNATVVQRCVPSIPLHRKLPPSTPVKHWASRTVSAAAQICSTAKASAVTTPTRRLLASTARCAPRQIAASATPSTSGATWSWELGTGNLVIGGATSFQSRSMVLASPPTIKLAQTCCQLHPLMALSSGHSL
jgi:hypothetical protein